MIQSIEWPYIHSCISLGWNNPFRNGWTNQQYMLTRMLMQGGPWREMPKKFEQFLWWPMLRRFDRPLFRLFAGSTSTFREDARKDCGDSGVGERRRGDKCRWHYWGQSCAMKWWDSNSRSPSQECMTSVSMTFWWLLGFQKRLRLLPRPIESQQFAEKKHEENHPPSSTAC